MTLTDCYKKVTNINNDLLELGYDYDFIESFWKGVFKEAKKRGLKKKKC